MSQSIIRCIPIVSVLVLTLGLAACGRAPVGPPTAMLPAATAVPAEAQPASEVDAAGQPDEAAASAIPTPTPMPAPPPASDFNPATATVSLDLFVDGLNRPLYLTDAGDGSGLLYVVERGGTVQVVENGAVADEPFLDLTARVNDGRSEQGLLGLAFDPDFAETGRFFVNYTAADDATVVAELTTLDDDPRRADPDSLVEVLRVDQPARNHNAGMLAFGPDGYLYIGMGDGGGAGDQYENGQNPTSLLGKMLRIDVTTPSDKPYLIPADNPWVDRDWQGVDVPDEIWSVGLRNPWRYSFDPATGDLWLPDVGQSQYEEINRVPQASGSAFNFGWPIMEGSHCYPDTATCDPTGLHLPVAEYGHDDGNCSITGGYVYRGAAYPVLDGVYVFGDYCSGDIRTLRADGSGKWIQEIVYEDAGRISSFGQDAQGELYVIDIVGGAINRLVVE